jgi:hypothetical protein
MLAGRMGGEALRTLILGELCVKVLFLDLPRHKLWLQAIDCRSINHTAFPLANSNDNHNQPRFHDLINQSIASAFKFDFVTVGHSLSAVSLNSRL